MSRILLVCPWFYPAWKSGGTAIAAYNTAKVYVKLGHHVDVFTTRENGDELLDVKGKVIHDDIRIHYFNYLPFYKGSAWSPTLLVALCRKAHAYDFICINGVRNSYELLLLLMHRIGFLKAKICVTPHAAWRRDWLDEVGNRYLVRLYQTMIVKLTRNITCQYLSQDEKLDSPKLYSSDIIIPNYIQPLEATNCGHGRNNYVMLCRVHPQKAIERALCLLRDNKNKVLHIYGPIDDSKYYRMLLKQIGTQGLGIRVQFKGPYNYEDLGKILSNYSAMIFSSHVEGVSMAMLEGLSSGLPIIYSDGVGNLETLTEYMPETLVKNWNQTNKIVQAIDAKWMELSLNSLRMFNMEYSERTIMEKWSQYFK